MTNDQTDQTVERAMALGLLVGVVLTLLAMLRGHGFSGASSVGLIVGLAVAIAAVVALDGKAVLDGEA